jgi:Ig-like domain from next to BRCA1 gene
LAPNQSIDVTASFVAPQFPGTYFATYRLTYGDNIEFGDKLFINIKIEKNDEPLKE